MLRTFLLTAVAAVALTGAALADDAEIKAKAQSFAQTEIKKWAADPDIVAATITKRGVVLRRPVGSAGSFGEHAELPTDLGGPGPTKATRKSKGRTAKQPSSRPVDKAAERKAALAFEKEQKRRERERASEEAAKQKDRERRQQAVDKAQAALNKAEQEHAKRAAAIQAEVEALGKRSQTEEARWDREKARLGAAGEQNPLSAPATRRRP